MASATLIDVLLSSLSSVTFYLLLAVVAAIVYTKYQNIRKDDWRRYGVKSPITDFSVFDNDFRSKITKIFQQYGDTIGLYEGPNLVLLTANLDLWRNILIKDFSNFVDRQAEIPSSSPFFKSLFFAPGSVWRRHRQIVSPTFTTGKLKYIAKSIDKSAQELVGYLEKFAKNGLVVSMKDTCGRYTSEIIAKTAFGLNAQFINEDKHEFYEYSKNMINFMNKSGIYKIIFILLQKIPYLRKLSITVLNLQYYDPINKDANQYFDVILKNTIEERNQQQKNGVEKSHPDFLDLLMKANAAAAAGKLEATEEIFLNSNESESSKSVQQMTVDEILAQSMLVIFAGMETTATTLQMCLYQLAANPDVQEKVIQEIRRVVKGPSPTPEELNSLTYTEQVLNETLRLYPPAPTVNRIAKETKTYNGVTIPKGTSILIPYFYVMKDPQIFPEPEKFDPDRFSPEVKDKRDSIAFSPFGQGPRLCLGMRLAYMELKHGLVHILRKLKVVLNDRTEPKIGSEGVAIADQRLVIPEKPIRLFFELRESNKEEIS